MEYIEWTQRKFISIKHEILTDATGVTQTYLAYLSGGDGEEEHDGQVDKNAGQWNKVVVVLGLNGDVDDDEDD